MCRLTDLDDRNRMTGYLPFSIGAENNRTIIKKKVNVLALGDVGGMLITGLRLLGADVIDTIGLYDMNENMASRYEIELNQIAFPFDSVQLPKAEVITQEKLFDCDVFVFCASKGIPKIGEAVQDVRMAQFEANRKIVESYGQMAARKHFKGLFAVVSDPVDPLCKAVYLAAEGGLLQEQIQGFGLGVMNSRAMYFAKKNSRYESYLKEGRAFGPHGDGLVIANSIENYDDGLSKELTELTEKANLEIRELGFKPYIAPALSSGTISILLTLRGQWHYSSNFIGSGKEGAFMGALNRMTEHGLEFEDMEIPRELFKRIKDSYGKLKQII